MSGRLSTLSIELEVCKVNSKSPFVFPQSVFSINILSDITHAPNVGTLTLKMGQLSVEADISIEQSKKTTLSVEPLIRFFQKNISPKVPLYTIANFGLELGFVESEIKHFGKFSTRFLIF